MNSQRKCSRCGEPLDDDQAVGLCPQCRQQVKAILERALLRLRQQWATNGGDEALFVVLAKFLSHSETDSEIAAVGSRFQMQSEAVVLAIRRLRQRFRAHVKDELSQTTNDDPDICA
jgi:NMD protein affecting ribosome stability and mRNA decay